MHLKGKNVIITGGSSGIGKATAEHLSAAGANVFIVARDRGKLDRVLEKIRANGGNPGPQCGAFSADVSSYEDVEAAAAAIQEAGGAPDILINSAGVVYPGYFDELPLSSFRGQMDTNYFGTLHSVKAVLPHMMAQGSGHIVNISSLAGALGVFGYTGYVASKFAVCGFSEALRVELKRHNIGVSVVLPFDTETPGLREERRTRPLEADVSFGAVRPEGFRRPGQVIAYWLLRALSGGGEPMTADQVAQAILNGLRRERYLIVPDLTLKAAYYLRGLLIPLINWAWDQLLPLFSEQEARRRGEQLRDRGTPAYEPSEGS